MDAEKKVVGFTALFEILMILKRELSKEKNDEMKYSHFLCTLERTNQEKLKMAIMQLKCVPCLNKFTTNFNLINNSNSSGGNLMNNCTNNSNASLSSKNMVSHANMSRLLKQMSLIVSTELQQIAIDLVERMDEDKPVKYIKLKDEFKFYGGNGVMSQSSHCLMPSPMGYCGGGKSNSGSNMIPIPGGKSKQSMMASSSSSSSLSNNSSANIMSPASAAFALLRKQQQMQIQSLANNFKQLELSAQQQQQQSSISSSSASSASSSSSALSSSLSSMSLPSSASSASRMNLFNPHSNLQQFMSEQKAQDFAAFTASIDRSCQVTNSLMYSDRI